MRDGIPRPVNIEVDDVDSATRLATTIRVTWSRTPDARRASTEGLDEFVER
jgi:hypothetical protein